MWRLLLISLALHAKPLELDVSAVSAVLMNAETGRILFEKEPHKIGYPASTTKVGTVLYLLERGPGLEKTAIVSEEALQPKSREEGAPYLLHSDGTMMWLKKGEVLTLDSLLYGMMLVSGNDASNVAAELAGGSIETFMEGFNQYLNEIGCKNTRFMNPHGLPYPGHVSTVYDMALMMQRALKIGKFRELIGTKTYLKPKSNKQPSREIKLTNPMLRERSKFYYPKAIGGKTGHTEEAKFPFVGAASDEERTLIAVVFGSPTSDARFADAKKMFEAAFNQKKASKRLIGPETIFSKELPCGKEALQASLVKGLTVSYYPAEEPECKASLKWDEIELPVKKGARVGAIEITDQDGRIFDRGDLIAMNDVETSFFLFLKEKVIQLFR